MPASSLCRGCSAAQSKPDARRCAPLPTLCSTVPIASCSSQRGASAPAQSAPSARWRPAVSNSRCLPAQTHLRAQGDESSNSDPPVEYAKEFGNNRKDVIIIGVGLLAAGYALYYGVQALGVEPGQAGNFVQLFILLVLCVGWTASYLLRVVNKDMTYSKQLKQYEEAVMQKRLEEMPETERSRLFEEVEAEKARKASRS